VILNTTTEDSLRFYALRLHEVGMIKSSPNALLAEGTDWRFLNELKRELKRDLRRRSASSARGHVLRGHTSAISIGARLNPRFWIWGEAPAFPRLLPLKRSAQWTLWVGFHSPEFTALTRARGGPPATPAESA
jgi:hypothetical protein